MKQGKIWGTTWPLFNKNGVELHRIEVKAGGFCSLHHHEHKYNWFFVVSGELRIIEHKGDTGTIDTTTLEEWESCCVPPGNKHMFKAMADTVAFEAYWSELDPEDIIRDKPGGLI